MKPIRLLLAVSLCAALAQACSETKNTSSDSLEPCSEDGTCSDSSKVCINHYCLNKCTKDSCGKDEVCPSSGICTKGECSDIVPCSGDLVCQGAKCVERGTPVDDPEKKGTAKEGEKCSEQHLCESYLRCSDEGVCVKKCYTTGCETGFACSNEGVCVKGDCTTWQRCSEKGFDDTFVCDTAERKCVKKCSAGSCGDGKYCDSSDKLCHVGECSEVDACKNNLTVCDLTPGSKTIHTCIDKCTSDDSCGADKLCDTDGRCVEPCASKTCQDGKVCDPNSRLCIQADCSTLDACSLTYQVCDEGHCVDKCTMQGVKCPEDKYCETLTGLCKPVCTPESCAAQGLLCGDEGMCVKGECSSYNPCSGTKVCSADYKCVEPVKPNNDCYFYKNCDDCDAKFDCSQFDCEITACDSCGAESEAYSKCHTELFACLDAGNFYENCPNHCEKELDAKTACETKRNACIKADKEDCASLTDEAQIAACEATNTCKSDKRTCESQKSTCLTAKQDCESKSKLCPEGQRCTADNRCVPSAELNGLGLGESCDPMDKTQKCATGLVCLMPSTNSEYVCLQEAYAAQGKPCTASAYQDHCEGNIIVQCSEYYGMVMVYDCKTNYIDWDVGVVDKFYGDNFTCAKRPGTKLVGCVQMCNDASAKEWYGCGYDTSDESYEVDYSDRYLCKYNSEGIQAYYYQDSEECSCSYSTGRCN